MTKSSEKTKLNRRLYYKKNREEFLKKAAKYRKENKEKIAIAQKEYFKRPEVKKRRNERLREKVRKDFQFKLNKNASSAISSAFSKNSLSKEWEEAFGYTLSNLREHIESLFTEEMSWENYGTVWQLDHIRPKSSFYYKTTKNAEFKECWALSNLRPLSPKSNMKKGSYYKTNKKKLLEQFGESCKFYCEYHKVGKLETTMICGNLSQVVLRIIKAINKNKDSI